MKNFDRYPQRTVFTVFMTVLATLFGGGMAFYELHWQPDVVIDVVKIISVLGLGTAGVSYVFWTVTHMRKDSLMRGAVTGGLTGFVIIQLPFFASGFKTAMLANYAGGQTSLLVSALDAIFPAVTSGLLTFQVITKISLIALVASIFLGLTIAWIVPSSRGGNSQTPR